MRRAIDIIAMFETSRDPQRVLNETADYIVSVSVVTHATRARITREVAVNLEYANGYQVTLKRFPCSGYPDEKPHEPLVSILRAEHPKILDLRPNEKIVALNSFWRSIGASFTIDDYDPAKFSVSFSVEGTDEILARIESLPTPDVPAIEAAAVSGHVYTANDFKDRLSRKEHECVQLSLPNGLTFRIDSFPDAPYVIAISEYDVFYRADLVKIKFECAEFDVVLGSLNAIAALPSRTVEAAA